MCIRDRLHDNAHFHGPLILMYHSIVAGADIPDSPWAVAEVTFNAQLDFLRAEGWHSTTLAGLIQTASQLSERTVVVTFDDGYADNFKAFEALAIRQMQASWFIVTGSIGQSQRWADPDAPRRSMLNIGQIREMYSAGMEFGSHTVSHAKLPELDTDIAFQELRDSKACLENLSLIHISEPTRPY